MSALWLVSSTTESQISSQCWWVLPGWQDNGNISRQVQSKSDKRHSATIALASICEVFKTFSCVKTSIKQLCELKLVQRLPLEFLSLSCLYSDILFSISRNRKYSDSQKLYSRLCFVSNSHSRFYRLTPWLVFCVTTLNCFLSVLDVRACECQECSQGYLDIHSISRCSSSLFSQAPLFV